MSTNLVINFNGQGQEAVAQYAKVFGLETPEIITYGSIASHLPFPLSEEEKNNIFSTTLCINGLTIMIQDLVKSMQEPFNSNITISISANDEETVTRWFDAMSIGGKVTCPLREMPWSKWYGAVKDKFGTSWQFQCE